MAEMGRLGDQAEAQADGHKCPKCPHSVKGPATQGSPDVFVNNMPALRIGDQGVHKACCGDNKWEAELGSGTVLINSKNAHRKGDVVKHCGGPGELVEGSADVDVGD